MEKIDLGNGVAMEAVQETLARHALHAEHPTPNPLNPPCQGDLSLNSPLIRGARGVRNDEYWIFAQSLWRVKNLSAVWICSTGKPNISVQITDQAGK